MILMVAFVCWELRTPEPLLRLQIFRDRGFSAETAILGMISVAFVPFFFFASEYAQVSLGENASHAGLYILYFFIGFVILAQVGGRILDRRGAKPAVVGGCALAAVGLLPARRQDDRPVAVTSAPLHHARGRRPGPDARHGEHGRGQPRAEHELQRGRPASRRPPATSARASGSRSSGRSWSARTTRTSPTP